MDRTKASEIVESGSPETGSHQVAKASLKIVLLFPCFQNKISKKYTSGDSKWYIIKVTPRMCLYTCGKTCKFSPGDS